MAGIETTVIAPRSSNADEANRTAHLLIGKIKDRTPRRSGNLAAGWSFEPVSNARDPIIITNNVSYASFVNNGTRKMAPRRMLEKGISAMGGKVRKI